jgi:hypothetical protein
LLASISARAFEFGFARISGAQDQVRSGAGGVGTQPLTKMLREGDVRRYAGAVIDQENGINGRQEAWPALSIRNIEILEGDLKNGDMGRDTG